MENKPYMIMIASQKGGVGKTTIAINLAISLIYQKYSVLLVDGDIFTSSVSEQLGIISEGNGYKEAIEGDAKVEDTIFAYEPINLRIIPGSPSKEHFEPNPEKLERFYKQISKMEFDFIIVDNPPGLFNNLLARYFNEVAILTTADSTAAVSSSKLAAYCDKYKIKHRLIINRVGYSKFELNVEQVEKLFGDIAFAEIPEDMIISESLSKHKPAYLIDRNSAFSMAIDELSRAYTLRAGEPQPAFPFESDRNSKGGFFSRLMGWGSR